MMKIVLEARHHNDLDSGSACFPDVAASDRFSPYVCYAKAHAIVKGYPDGSF